MKFISVLLTVLFLNYANSQSGKGYISFSSYGLSKEIFRFYNIRGKYDKKLIFQDSLSTDLIISNCNYFMQLDNDDLNFIELEQKEILSDCLNNRRFAIKLSFDQPFDVLLQKREIDFKRNYKDLSYSVVVYYKSIQGKITKNVMDVKSGVIKFKNIDDEQVGIRCSMQIQDFFSISLFTEVAMK